MFFVYSNIVSNINLQSMYRVSRVWKCLQLSEKLNKHIVSKHLQFLYSNILNLNSTIHMYSGITSGRVLNGELLYTKILEVNLFAFAYRLFRRDFSPLDGTYCMGTHSFLQPYIHFVLIWEGFTRHDNNKEESYIGLTDNTFKTRYNGHTSSFRNEQYRNATTLSNYIWTLKDKNINYSLKWKIIDRGRAYQPSGKNCGLCDLEKFYIISRPELASLNQRNELATSCRHRKKHLLCNK